MKKELYIICALLSFYLPAICQPTNPTFCHETELTFSVNGSDRFLWYNAPEAGTYLGEGPSITVNKGDAFLSTTDPDTVYSLFAQGKLKGGFTSSEANLGHYGTTKNATLGLSALKIRFATTKAVSIDSMTISVSTGTLNCSFNSSPKINLVFYKPDDANFSVTKSITFNCVGSGEGFYKIPVGVQLDSAGEYGVKVAFGQSNSYKLDYYMPSSSLYPNTLSNILTFTGDDDGVDSTYLIPSLLDWVISLPEDRIEITDLRNCPLGIELLDLSTKDIAEVYPNPFKESCSYIWKKTEPVIIRISDAQGNPMAEYNLSNASEIQLGASFPTGMYFVTSITSSKSFLTKLIKY